jgi:signal transduction histidine kinase/DNA-binding response OmpR family regulator
VKKRSVLFVDDEPDVLSAIKRLMIDEPYDILYSESGEEALNILKNRDVHVVVVDLKMPKMDGLTLLKEIEQYNPHIIRLVLSVLSDSDSILTATNKGKVHRYITKPWNDNELKIIVEQAVQLFDEQQEKRDLLKKIEQQEIIQREHAVRLATINKETTMQNNKLQKALNVANLLIHNVISDKDYVIMTVNNHLEKCYEVKNCHKMDCPCYEKEAMRCWQVAGTYCGGEVQGEFAQKYENCSQCEVYVSANSDPIIQIQEQFNIMMHLLNVKNDELSQANKNLQLSQATIIHQEKMASIGQLAAGVAHEINNPTGFVNSNLNSLDKYVGRLIEFIEAQSEAVESLGDNDIKNILAEKKKKMKIDYICSDIKEVIKESLEGTDRIGNIVNNLKGFARLDTNKTKNINLNQCLDSTLNVVWNELKYKTTVEKDYGELPLIEGYQQQLTQVFVNILVNAAQAIEKQGDIKIKTYNSNGSNVVIISDTGSGISEDKIPKIFEPFFTTKEVGKGTGLGMSIAYDIVLKHKGKIDVESEVGTGTTFTIELPIVESKT